MSTPVEQATEQVAEAMWAATSNTDLAWREIPVVVMNGYRDMARAAIESLQLTEERRVARSICDMADPGIPESRLVGPWRAA